VQKKRNQSSFDFGHKVSAVTTGTGEEKGHGRVSEFPTAEVRGRVESAFRQRVVSDLLRSRVAKK
jgi:hypothetical protein